MREVFLEGRMVHYWPPRKSMTGLEAVEKINSLIHPRRVTRGWLYVNVK